MAVLSTLISVVKIINLTILSDLLVKKYLAALISLHQRISDSVALIVMETKRILTFVTCVVQY